MPAINDSHQTVLAILIATQENTRADTVPRFSYPNLQYSFCGSSTVHGLITSIGWSAPGNSKETKIITRR